MRRLLDLIRSHRGDAALALFLAAGLIGAYSQAVLPARHGGEMWNLAWNLANHGTFANPFSPLPTGPTASNPPLAPLLTAILVRALRVPFLIYLSSALLSILANALCAALLPRLSLEFFGDVIPGIVAAVLWMFTMEVIPGWDTNYTAAGLIAFSCVSATSLSGEETRARARWIVAAGFLAGALCLLNPATLFVWPLWLVYLLWRVGFRNGTALAACGTIIVIAFAIVSGWCARNERAIGGFVIRTGMGIELYVSNNDCAQPTILEEDMNGCFPRLHPGTNLKETFEFRRLGEIAYNSAKAKAAAAWIEQHPDTFTKLSWARFIDFWFPAAESIPSTFAFPENFGVANYMTKWQQRQHRIAYATWFSTALSCLGFALMIYDRCPVAWFVAASLTLYPLMYYITIADMRYRDPVLWISLLPAGYLLTRIPDRRSLQAEEQAATYRS